MYDYKPRKGNVKGFNSRRLIYTYIRFGSIFTILFFAGLALYYYRALIHHDDKDKFRKPVLAQNGETGFNIAANNITQDEPDAVNTIEDIKLPEGYTRIQTDGFGGWLRKLPLKSPDARVLLYNGELKANQSAHYRVIDLPIISKKDLHQCADAVIRLRAQYLYSEKKYDQITFHFTSGDVASFEKWAQGYRPVVSGRTVRWKKTGAKGYGQKNFESYLETVFMYAGTYSLQKELRVKTLPGELQIGDVFIQGGFPGHAVIVVDVAVHSLTNEKIFLLAQSYMPAQEIHVLKNPGQSITPWYKVGSSKALVTPEWNFLFKNLMSF